MGGQASRINGRLGGRPKLEATKFREALLNEIEKHALPLAQKLVEMGLKGDIAALREIFDRGMGKVRQTFGATDGEGNDMPLPIIAVTVSPKSTIDVLPDKRD